MKDYKERLFNMTLHNVRVFWVGLSPIFFKRQNSSQHSKTLRNKTVGNFSAFGCSVLVSSIWKNVVPTLFQTLDINTPPPKSDKHPTFSWFSCAAFCVVVPTLFQTLDINTPQPKSDKHPTFSWFSCAALVLFCRTKKGLTLKIRTLCIVM